MYAMPTRNDAIKLLLAGVLVIGVLAVTKSVGASAIVQIAAIAAALAGWMLVFGSRIARAEQTASDGWLDRLRDLTGLSPRKK